MPGDPRWMIRIVQRDGLAVHGDDLKGLPLKFQVHVASAGCVRDPPELPLSGRNFNLRPHGPVHRHDLLRWLLLAATDFRTKVNTLLQIGRLRIACNGTAAYNQHTLAQPDERGKIRFHSLDHERTGHTIQYLSVALSVGVRVI